MEGRPRRRRNWRQGAWKEDQDGPRTHGVRAILVQHPGKANDLPPPNPPTPPQKKIGSYIIGEMIYLYWRIIDS